MKRLSDGSRIDDMGFLHSQSRFYLLFRHQLTIDFHSSPKKPQRGYIGLDQRSITKGCAIF
jgi:hypothetical protein